MLDAHTSAHVYRLLAQATDGLPVPKTVFDVGFLVAVLAFALRMLVSAWASAFRRDESGMRLIPIDPQWRSDIKNTLHAVEERIKAADAEARRQTDILEKQSRILDTQASVIDRMDRVLQRLWDREEAKRG